MSCDKFIVVTSESLHVHNSIHVTMCKHMRLTLIMFYLLVGCCHDRATPSNIMILVSDCSDP